jgi:hypothetical protein
MGIDFDGVLRSAGDFLRRHIKTKAVREAEKRQRERRQREAARKFNRFCLVAGTSGAGLGGYALLIAPVSVTAAAAVGVATLVVAGASVTFPGRRRSASFSREELAALPCAAEEWLLKKRLELPVWAADALDPIFVTLGDLHRHLPSIDPNSTLAWEVRRLVGEHLPSLVEAFAELPTSAREYDPEVRHRLLASLDTLAEELREVDAQASRDRFHAFETRGRFIEAKYKDELPGR